MQFSAKGITVYYVLLDFAAAVYYRFTDVS